MTLYEIDNAILGCVDDETGEVIDFDKLDKLTMQREQKLEGAALAVKNLTAEAEAIKAEEKRLADRRKVIENKAEGYKGWLSNTLSGEKFETARVSCRFKRSKKPLLTIINFAHGRSLTIETIYLSTLIQNLTKIKSKRLSKLEKRSLLYQLKNHLA